MCLMCNGFRLVSESDTAGYDVGAAQLQAFAAGYAAIGADDAIANPSYTSLLSGSTWNAGVNAQSAIITYSFSTTTNTSASSTPAAFYDSFQQLTEGQKTIARDALSKWAAASGIVFVETTDAFADIKFGGYDFSKDPAVAQFAGYAYFPGIQRSNGLVGENPSGGDIFLDINTGMNLHVMMHEIGHAIGLKHPFEGALTLPVNLDNTTNTVMSYTGLGQLNLGLFDTQAAQHIYGTVDAGHLSTWNFSTGTGMLVQVSNGTATMLRGGAARDALVGAALSEQLFTGANNDTIYGNGGNDTAQGGTGNDVLVMGNGADSLLGEDGDDYVYAGGGNDTVQGGAGLDVLIGQDGNDSMFGGTGFNYFFGGSGADSLMGNGGAAATDVNVMFGEGDTDVLFGGAGTNYFYGGAGVDTLVGGAGLNIFIASSEGTGDYIQGGAGQNYVYGSNGGDTIFGGAGVDVFLGGTGGDFMFGNGGVDYAWGGAGADTFLIDNAIANVLVVQDYEPGIDKIGLKNITGSFADFQSWMFYSAGINTTIVTLPGATTAMWLIGHSPASFAAGDFVIYT